MKMPNFFIIGGPKCGTTSLVSWLRTHPNVYMSHKKEPHYFNEDLLYRNVVTWEDYLRIFRGAKERHTAVGEASVFYLYSRVAVSNIEGKFDQPRYIVMVRNPVDMAVSLHEQQIYSGNEKSYNFAKAWSRNLNIDETKKYYRFSRDPELLHYEKICKLGEQLNRLYMTVPRERVLVLVLDDIKIDPKFQYYRVLRFLNVPEVEKVSFPIKNSAKERRSQALRTIVVSAGRIKRRMAIGGGLGILNAIDKINHRERKRLPLSRAMKTELCKYFRSDVECLCHLLGRDLMSWVEE